MYKTLPTYDALKTMHAEQTPTIETSKSHLTKEGGQPMDLPSLSIFIWGGAEKETHLHMHTKFLVDKQNLRVRVSKWGEWGIIIFISY